MDPQCQPLFVESSVSRALGRSESPVDGSRRVYRRSINPPVEKQHYEHRYVERAQSRINDVTGIVNQFAGPRTGRGLQQAFLLPPADQRRETYRETENPNGGDQYFRPSHGHDTGVGDRPGYGHVPVQRYSAQVQNGGRAHPDVHRQPNATPDVTEYPNLHKNTTLDVITTNHLPFKNITMNIWLKIVTYIQITDKIKQKITF